MTFKRWQSIKKTITNHSKHKKLENQNWIKIKPRIWRLWKRNVLRRPPHLYYFTQCKLLWRSLYLDKVGSKWDIFLSKTKFWWDLLWYESKKKSLSQVIEATTLHVPKRRNRLPDLYFFFSSIIVWWHNYFWS